MKYDLRKYAELIVRKGLNPDKGQDVVIAAELDQPEFVRMVVEECYKCGAARVIVDWTDMAITKLGYLYRSEENMSSFENWEVERLRWQSEKLPARLWLDSDDPDGMNGIDTDKRARVQMARFPVIKPFRDAMENRHQWCIAGVPGVKWARKVFPGVADGEAVDRLWEAILKASRADRDPIAAWDEHNAEVARRCEIINAYHFRSLEYRSSNGTDFRVGLIPQARFEGAAERDLQGRVFNPNIPSEEIFTSPKRGCAEGVLVATKPLSYQGSLIEDFSVTFREGRAVSVKAARGQDVLEKMIAMDDGAAYLGECALIGYDSPINNTGILFYSTLFDENASCHVALGRGFDECIDGFERLSQDEIHALGINDSMIHVDFMIGSRDLSISGCTEGGDTVAIFRDGEWCF